MKIEVPEDFVSQLRQEYLTLGLIFKEFQAARAPRSKVFFVTLERMRERLIMLGCEDMGSGWFAPGGWPKSNREQWEARK